MYPARKAGLSLSPTQSRELFSLLLLFSQHAGMKLVFNQFVGLGSDATLWILIVPDFPTGGTDLA
jgi:hypothetical protein